MTSRELVVLLIGIVRQTPDDGEAAKAVLTYLCDHGLWFARQVEDSTGVIRDVPLRRGRARRRLFQALLPFEVEHEDQSVLGSR